MQVKAGDLGECGTGRSGRRTAVSDPKTTKGPFKTDYVCLCKSEELRSQDTRSYAKKRLGNARTAL
jgi:hypothetical protein